MALNYIQKDRAVLPEPNFVTSKTKVDSFYESKMSLLKQNSTVRITISDKCSASTHSTSQFLDDGRRLYTWCCRSVGRSSKNFVGLQNFLKILKMRFRDYNGGRRLFLQ